jgi:hypothetical protein
MRKKFQILFSDIKHIVVIFNRVCKWYPGSGILYFIEISTDTAIPPSEPLSY